MTRIILLERLRDFTKEATKDLLLPVRMQEDDDEQPPDRPASVYLMRLPDYRSATTKAPYILHQVVTGADIQHEGERAAQSSAVIRTIFCVYHEDEQEGALCLLNLMERLRIAMLESPIIGNQFELNTQEGIETLIHPDGAPAIERTAPYYLGEMLTTWELPEIMRKDADPWRKEKQNSL